MIEAAALVAILAAAMAAGVSIVRASRREQAGRRTVLDACGALLEDSAAGVAPSGYGVLRGRMSGRAASLTPIAEAMAFRRLPQLWIAAAIRRDDGPAGAIDIVRRPTGAEFFTGGAGLPLSLRPPASWPQDTSVRCDRAGADLIFQLERPLAAALMDPRLKCVTVTPRGMRVVRQAAQGERMAYLLFRQTSFASVRVSPEDAGAALSLAASLVETLTIEVRHAA